MKAYQLKIELKGTQIWRRVIIPAGATFYRLFDTIQRSMRWMGESLYEYHLYEFDIKEENLKIANDVEAYEENKLYKTQYRKLDKTNEPLGIIEMHLRVWR